MFETYSSIEDQMEGLQEMLNGDGEVIERVLNTWNDGKGSYGMDTVAFAIMGVARNIQRIDKELKRLRAQSNSLDPSCY